MANVFAGSLDGKGKDINDQNKSISIEIEYDNKITKTKVQHEFGLVAFLMNQILNRRPKGINIKFDNEEE